MSQRGVTDRQIAQYHIARAMGDVKAMKKLSATLIEQNMGLVYKAVGQYRVKRSMLAFADAKDDLIQAGIIGILKALDVHNPARGKFSCIAVWKIRHEIQRELCKQMTTTVSRPSAIETRIDFSTLDEDFMSHSILEDLEDQSRLVALLDEIAISYSDQEQEYLSLILHGMSELQARRHTNVQLPRSRAIIKELREILSFEL